MHLEIPVFEGNRCIDILVHQVAQQLELWELDVAQVLRVASAVRDYVLDVALDSLSIMYVALDKLGYDLFDAVASLLWYGALPSLGVDDCAKQD